MNLTVEEILRSCHKISGDIFNSTSRILDLLLKSQFDQADLEVQRRNSMINVFINFKKIIEQNDRFKSSNSYTKWNDQIIKNIKEVELADKKIVQLLEIHKDSTSKEISHIKKKRSLFKGYNLNNVRR